MTRRERLICLTLGLLAVAAVEITSAPTRAQAIWPYRTLVIRRAAYFTDPQVDPERAQTPSLSYPALSRELERMVRDDPRFESVDETELVITPTVQSQLSVAQGQRDLGIEQFGQYEIDTAIFNLTEAVDFYRRARAELIEPREMAVAYEYLARAHLERARIDPGEAASSVAQARRDFTEMIRLNPNAEIRAGLFPEAVVEQFRQAYSELLMDDGRDLGLRDSTLDHLFESYDIEVVVYPFFIRDESGVRMVLEVYEGEVPAGSMRRPTRWVVDLPRDQERALRRVNRTFSRYLACAVLRYAPPPPGHPGDAGQVFLQAGWGAGVYGERPTEGQFFSQGLGLTIAYHLTDNLGLFGRANILFGGRDPQGDLLSGFTSTRTAVGVAFAARVQRLRVYMGTGLEVNFVGSFTASDSFWCKVTGGHFERLGSSASDPVCLSIDVTDQGGQALVGPYLMPGASIDIIGPFGAYLIGSFAFYVNSGSDIDFPLGGEAGIEYRF